ncbi:LysR substrate-binding domain-containing protein [Bacillus cereus]
MILAFLRPPIPTQLLELEPIQRLSCTLCLPKAHPLAEKDEIHIEDLRDEPFVFITRPVWPLCMIQFYLFAEKLDLVHVLYKKQQSIKQLWGL